MGVLCFKLAADEGDANGMFAYGTILLKGHKEVLQDYILGRELIRKAVKQNHLFGVYSYMLSLSIGLNYMSCVNSLDIMKILIENLLNSNLKVEVS